MFDACFIIRAQVHRLKKDIKAAWIDTEQAIEHGAHDKLTLSQVRNFHSEFVVLSIIFMKLHFDRHIHKKELFSKIRETKTIL